MVLQQTPNKALQRHNEGLFRREENMKDKWREEDIAHLFMFLRAARLGRQSIITVAFISFIKKSVRREIMYHSVGCV